MKKLNLLDRALMQVSPSTVAKRVLSRLQTEELMKVGSSGFNHGNRSETRWRGASQVLRSMSAWVTHLGSGRSDLSKAERERMASRSYDAYRNHMVARAAVTRMRTNVVGTGLIMHPTVDAEALGLDDDAAGELNAEIAREWCAYYDDPTEVDIEATHDGAGLQSLALITALLSGDCWALTPYEERTGKQYGIKMQLIDPARVSNPNGGPNVQTLQDGVEISPIGVPIKIHIRNRHPDDRFFVGTDQWIPEPIFGPSGARRVLQIWNDKDRIGATRGAPFLAPILEPLQQLEQYSRAELMAAVISSLFTVFIEKSTTGPADDRGNPLPAIEGQTVSGKGEASDLKLGNGAILDLGPGEKASFADPSRPNSGYDPFFMSLVKQMGAALELPVDELLLAYQSSYSAARAVMLQAWRLYVMRRWWMVQQFCQPHYQLWFDEAVARGRLKLVSNYGDPARRRAYQKAIWIGPARGAMDETKEATAAKQRIDAGISNETIETAASTGESWNSVYAQRARELKRRREDGNLLGPAPGQASGPQQQATDQTTTVPRETPDPSEGPGGDPNADPLDPQES